MKSGTDHGALYQLRNLINRRNVVSDPKNNFNACDDFFGLIVQCRILAAAMTLLEMDTLDSVPTDEAIFDLQNVWMLPDHERRSIITKLSAKNNSFGVCSLLHSWSKATYYQGWCAVIRL